MKENEIEVWGTTEAQDVSSNAVNSQGEKCRIVRTYDEGLNLVLKLVSRV